jgi:hypothetical protein
MNSLSDTLTMGIVLSLVFGSLIFYLYSRLLQVEKRMALTENILLDLKMATENTLLAMGSPHEGNEDDHQHQNQQQAERVEAVSGPQPILSQDVEELHEEDFYKNILATASDETEASPENDAAAVLKEIQLTDSTQSRTKETATVTVSKVEPNYESMSLKELKALVKSRGLQVTSHAGKKEVIDTLKKGSTVEAGSSSSTAYPIEGAEILE